MNSISIILPILFLLSVVILSYWNTTRRESLEVLEKLSQSIAAAHDPIDWKKTETAIGNISDRLGKAGFLAIKQRQQAKLILAFMFCGSLCLAFLIGVQRGTSLAISISLAGGAYLGAMTTLFYLRYKTNRFQQDVAFQIPLLLENIILLVESGYGVLPALEYASSPTTKPNTTKQLFHLVYQLSAFGLPFNRALEVVADATEIKILRHVLMHLDISNAEGGELVPSLRGLSEHAHHEWKMGVETRVKKLENLVVFPVFAAVIGLMLLISAVPIVPLLELRASMQNRGQYIGNLKTEPSASLPNSDGAKHDS